MNKLNTGYDYHNNPKLLTAFTQAGRNCTRIKKDKGIEIHHILKMSSIVDLFLSLYPYVEISWHNSPSGTPVSNFSKKEYKDLFKKFHDHLAETILVSKKQHLQLKSTEELIDEDLSIYPIESWLDEYLINQIK